jgi:hypothetical protein
MRLTAVAAGVLLLWFAGVVLFADVFLRSDDSNLLVGFVGFVVSVGFGAVGVLLVRWGARGSQ